LGEKKRHKQEDENEKKSLAVNNNSISKTPDKVANSHDMPYQYSKVKNAEKGERAVQEVNIQNYD
jgi:hypothetical protein